MIERLTLEDPAAAAAERIAAVAEGGGHIALAGGSTPRAAYERAAAMDIDWSRCTLWLGDERCVPPADERSNHAMVRAALLDRIKGAAPTVHRIRGELGPHEGAAAYERVLHEECGEGVPRIDLVLLGLGPDGHCASLFPDDGALEEKRRLAIGVDRPGLAPWVARVTLTLPVLNAAREVIFLVSGADKAEAAARAFGGDPDPSVPASLVSPLDGKGTALMDAAAAARLAGGRQR